MSRVAIFVDAGYLYARVATRLVHDNSLPHPTFITSCALIRAIVIPSLSICHSERSRGI